MRSAAAAASTSAFHLGVLIAGAADDPGGIASGIGIEDPRRKVDAVSEELASAARLSRDGGAPKRELAAVRARGSPVPAQ